MQIPSDGILMGSNTLAGDLGGITILTPWSNGNGCDLEGRFFLHKFHLTSEYQNENEDSAETLLRISLRFLIRNFA